MQNNKQAATQDETKAVDVLQPSKDFQFYFSDSEEIKAIEDEMRTGVTRLAAICSLRDRNIIARPKNLLELPPTLAEIVGNLDDACRWWKRLLTKSGMLVRGIIVREERFWKIVYRFAIDDLANRLKYSPTTKQQVRAWYHVSEAVVPGEGDIPDLTAKTMHFLNPFLPREQQFPSPFDTLSLSRTEQRPCARLGCRQTVTSRRRYCSEKCSKASRMLKWRNRRSRTKNAVLQPV